MEAAVALTGDAPGRAASQPGDGGEKTPPERKVYMDYNATTPLEPEVIQVMTEAMREAWGNPSSPYPTAVTFVPVSKVSGQVEVEDILAAVRPATCLVTVMLANNETGVIMPIAEISQRIKALNRKRAASGLPVILVHTDAAQALGKRRVDVEALGVDFLTIVGHKFYGPRIGALYVRGLGELTPLYPMLFGGGQERNFRPGTENTPMIAGLGKAAELVTKNWEAYEAHMRDVRDYLEERLLAEFGKQRIHLNSRFPGTERLPNTCNFSIRGPQLQGHVLLAQCRTLLASVGAACHSDQVDRPSPVLLSCGIPFDVARNALRLSVGRSTTRAEVDLVVQDLKQAVARLEGPPGARGAS
ncbi:selenocysteine lyase isoform X3 [Leopardus geoffroyi]|uniref:selenocysteine lyase isoform X3 n=1 Tax=Leopardus geoffroyi TaxID=46844 RepID=UPI001E26606A|nr:selenocysteine lyase isoform X3 [Leopardus geoffroyi]